MRYRKGFRSKKKSKSRSKSDPVVVITAPPNYKIEKVACSVIYAESVILQEALQRLKKKARRKGYQKLVSLKTAIIPRTSESYSIYVVTATPVVSKLGDSVESFSSSSSE